MGEAPDLPLPARLLRAAGLGWGMESGSVPRCLLLPFPGLPEDSW